MKPESYKEAVTELEGILAKMESNQCDIDSLSALTTRALELLKFCKERLFKTDEELTRCLDELKTALQEQ
ncbi:MAG: exodeoxyribonuclease VII small subunit [Candidatus Amulumruptor caecigallinarius]|nr:exodeoxyribonuclease VII small subunit [Candidatus Amulumruptor caecigallinarius]